MFDGLKQQLKEIGSLEIQVYAAGNYPNKQKTKVQDVAKWQNDGTVRIPPAKFVEKAEKKNRWTRLVGSAIDSFLDGKEFDLLSIGRRIAGDIAYECNRIDTGRLKRSFKYRINKV